MRDPNSLPVIPKPQLVAAVGGETTVGRAEKAGIVTFHRTLTGRDYCTPREFIAAVEWVDAQRAARKPRTG